MSHPGHEEAGDATLGVVLLGNDAIAAAAPATPVQLMHACHVAGFDVVVPPNWGDELVAMEALRQLDGLGRQPAVLVACPHVAARIEVLPGGPDMALVPTVAPPVAAARYLRRLEAGRRVHVTYVGGCPDAAHDRAIDARVLPDEFLASLAQRGIGLADQPTLFEDTLPPDRRRWVSLPGGVPTPGVVARRGGHSLVELDGVHAEVAARWRTLARGTGVVDAAAGLGCACSGALPGRGGTAARARVVATDPPRARSAVIAELPGLNLERRLTILPVAVAAARTSPPGPAPVEVPSQVPEIAPPPEPAPAPVREPEPQPERVPPHEPGVPEREPQREPGPAPVPEREPDPAPAPEGDPAPGIEQEQEVEEDPDVVPVEALHVTDADTVDEPVRIHEPQRVLIPGEPARPSGRRVGMPPVVTVAPPRAARARTLPLWVQLPIMAATVVAVAMFARGARTSDPSLEASIAPIALPSAPAMDTSSAAAAVPAVPVTMPDTTIAVRDSATGEPALDTAATASTATAATSTAATASAATPSPRTRPWVPRAGTPRPRLSASRKRDTLPQATPAVDSVALEREAIQREIETRKARMDSIQRRLDSLDRLRRPPR